MRKLSESVWGDIRKKSLGQEKRIENDIDQMSYTDFLAYILDTYKPTGKIIDIVVSESPHNFYLKKIRISIEKIKDAYPPVTIEYCTTGDDTYGYDRDEPYCVKVSDILFRKYPELWDMFEEPDFRINQTPGGVNTIVRHIGRMSNSDCIEILDRVLSVAQKPLFVKKLSESVWGDIRKKSLGQEEREENSLDNLTPQEFYEYLLNTYVAKMYFDLNLNSSAYEITDYNGLIRYNIYVPIEIRNADNEKHICMTTLLVSYSKNEKRGPGAYTDINDAIYEENPKLKDVLSQSFKVELEGGRVNIYRKSGDNLRNREVVNLIDTLLANAKYPPLEKQEKP